MLVITRKNGQSFHIGNDIVVAVKQARSGSAIISIQAPDNLPIMRTELLDGALSFIPLPDVEFLSEN